MKPTKPVRYFLDFHHKVLDSVPLTTIESATPFGGIAVGDFVQLGTVFGATQREGKITKISHHVFDIEPEYTCHHISLVFDYVSKEEMYD